MLLYYVSLFYCCGWVCRVVREDAALAFPRIARFAVPVLLAAALVTPLPKYPAYDRQEAPACVVAYKSLKLRDAYEFARDRDARLPVLENPPILDAVVGRVTACPTLFHNRDISSDPKSDRNRAPAAYYGKNSVILGQVRRAARELAKPRQTYISTYQAIGMFFVYPDIIRANLS